MNTNREPCKGKCSLSCTTIRVLKEMVVSQERTDDRTRVLQIGQFYLFMCDKSESDVDNSKSDVDNSKSDVDNSKSDIDNCTVTQPVKRELVPRSIGCYHRVVVLVVLYLFTLPSILLARSPACWPHVVRVSPSKGFKVALIPRLRLLP
jgi:hypothetical protein